MELPNIKYRGNLSKDVVAKDDYFEEIHYFKTADDFVDERSYSRYIKEIERLVRTNEDYKVFIGYVKNVLGIDFCQVFSHVYDKVDATVEFHHGPLFSLYDICEIELQRFLQDGLRVNVYRVADSVLDLHFQMKINGVMLSKTVHEMAHNNDLFLNQNIGDINSYIRERSKYFPPEIKYKIYHYCKLAQENPSFDRGSLDLEVVKTFLKVGGVESND